MAWTVQPDDTWLSKIRQAYTADEFLKTKETNLDLVERQDRILFKDRQYVPKELRKELVKEFHEHPLHGHQGVYKTSNRLKRTYDFLGLKEQVQEVIRECDTCNKAKANRHAPYGLLQPIQPPAKAW